MYEMTKMPRDATRQSQAKLPRIEGRLAILKISVDGIPSDHAVSKTVFTNQSKSADY